MSSLSAHFIATNTELSMANYRIGRKQRGVTMLQRATAGQFLRAIWNSPWTSNVHSLDRFRASAGSSQSRSWAVSITVMNALQRNDMAADAVLANDRRFTPTR